MSTTAAFSSFVDNVCQMFHASPVGTCWTNNYDLATLDNKRLSMSQLPPEEVLELAKAVEEGEEEQAVGIV